MILVYNNGIKTKEVGKMKESKVLVLRLGDKVTIVGKDGVSTLIRKDDNIYTFDFENGEQDSYIFEMWDGKNFLGTNPRISKRG